MTITSRPFSTARRARARHRVGHSVAYPADAYRGLRPKAAGGPHAQAEGGTPFCGHSHVPFIGVRSRRTKCARSAKTPRLPGGREGARVKLGRGHVPDGASRSDGFVKIGNAGFIDPAT
jgi:hypothetical protein